MFKPKAIYFENKILEYPLGKKLMEKYKEIPKIEFLVSIWLMEKPKVQ